MKTVFLTETWPYLHANTEINSLKVKTLFTVLLLVRMKFFFQYITRRKSYVPWAFFPKTFRYTSQEALIDLKLSGLITLTLKSPKHDSPEKGPIKPWALFWRLFELETHHKLRAIFLHTLKNIPTKYHFNRTFKGI